MCMIRDERWPLVQGCAGLLFAMLLSTSALAFTPKPGAVLAGAGLYANVVVLIDPTAYDAGAAVYLGQMGVMPGQRGANGVLLDTLTSHPRYRLGLFAEGRLRAPVEPLKPAHIAAMRAELGLLASVPTVKDAMPSLAQAQYEVTRYLRGLEPMLPGAGAWPPSPLELRCEPSAQIILTGSSPSGRFAQPGATLDDPDADNPAVAGTHNLPNWRGAAASYLPAEIARFSLDTDLRSRERHAVSVDIAGKSWDDKDFTRQRLRTFVIELAEPASTRELQDTAVAGGGGYQLASSASTMIRATQQVLTDISVASGLAGRGAVSARAVEPGLARHYRIGSDPRALQAFSLDAQGKPGAMLWTTDATFSEGSEGLLQIWDDRGRVVTVGSPGGAGVQILSESQRVLLEQEAVGAGYTGDQPAAALLRWVRGERVVGMRQRDRLMGAVINSTIRHSGTGVHAAGEPGAAYSAYKAHRAANMTPSLVFGANDGLLHLFDAETGNRRLSLMPSSELSKLGMRAHPGHENGMFLPGMDGPVELADVRIDSLWSTVAVAGMGAGGKALVAVEMFNQQRGNGALGGLWEKGHLDQAWQNLGFTYSAPAFARLRDGRSVVIVGNGYGSSNGVASLFIADAASGDVIREIMLPSRVDVAISNGLSSPLVRRDSTGVANAVYAGDLHGQLWKFDLGSEHPADWKVAFAGRPLFSATGQQPIAMQPKAGSHPMGGELILFGTGKFLEQTDLDDTAIQALYAVWDKPGAEGNLGPADLQSQSINDQPLMDGRRNRLVTRHAVDWKSQRGWSLSLAYGSESFGERATGSLALRSGRAVFTTGLIQPNDGGDPCTESPAGGWLMTVDLLTGGMPAKPVLDSDANGKIDRHDPPSAGVDLGIGLPGDMQIVVADGVEYYLVQGSEAATGIAALAGPALRRILWRQLM